MASTGLLTWRPIYERLLTLGVQMEPLEELTAIVEEALTRPGVLGARSSGGGCGGTVVVLCMRGALDEVDGLIR